MAHLFDRKWQIFPHFCMQHNHDRNENSTTQDIYRAKQTTSVRRPWKRLTRSSHMARRPYFHRKVISLFFVTHNTYYHARYNENSVCFIVYWSIAAPLSHNWHVSKQSKILAAELEALQESETAIHISHIFDTLTISCAMMAQVHPTRRLRWRTLFTISGVSLRIVPHVDRWLPTFVIWTWDFVLNYINKQGIDVQ